MQVVAIIPAYNEGKTVGEITAKLKNHSQVAKVIVINDGSKDNTSDVARKAGAQVIDLEENCGKGAAMEVGINTYEAKQADVILFLDADLIGLTDEHTSKLLCPVLKKEAEMVLGIFTNGRAPTDLGHKITPFLSGQRAVNREVLDNISDLTLTRFGVEMALTKHVKERDLKVEKVKLKDLTHRMKEEKLGFWKGLGERIKMYWEVLQSISDDENKLT